MAPKPVRHTLTKRVGALETRMHRVENAIVRIEPELKTQTGHLGALVNAIGQAPNLATGAEGSGLCGTLAALEQERRDRSVADGAQKKSNEETRSVWDRRRTWITWGLGFITAGGAVLAALHLLNVF